MPSPGAQLEFTAFTDEFIAWENRAALQEFFEDIRVPAGSTTDYGTFKQAAANDYTNPTLSNSDTFNLIVDDVPLGEVPTKESFVELKTAFNTLKDSYDSLLTKLRTAGILDS